ncbi:PREDICTED: proheparin-binding EGF-like growth factor [Corvus brachyrhynchos]|uniref:proheparin-binding EGF-like growth factor n=1 Tax=Corvus brachyrhynchos TaxID=85066 RepID=UPI0008167421|nr:PREDICTED: proheparin-binding EGF-like growth factor [Corvus brachyrhynchos]
MVVSCHVQPPTWARHQGTHLPPAGAEKNAPPPRARGQLPAQRGVGATAEQLWQPWDVALSSLWLARGADLTAVLSFPNCFPVAFLSKPQGLVTPKKKGNGNKRRKGKGLGKKRDPCLRKYKDFCIHGECKYIRELGAPSCICQPGYHGERCHGLLLPVEHPPSAYDHTTALAVVAVVLSSLCLVIIAALLMLRCHKRGGYDVENEEKIKLGITVNH